VMESKETKRKLTRVLSRWTGCALRLGWDGWLKGMEAQADERATAGVQRERSRQVVMRMQSQRLVHAFDRFHLYVKELQIVRNQVRNLVLEFRLGLLHQTFDSWCDSMMDRGCNHIFCNGEMTLYGGPDFQTEILKIPMAVTVSRFVDKRRSHLFRLSCAKFPNETPAVPSTELDVSYHQLNGIQDPDNMAQDLASAFQEVISGTYPDQVALFAQEDKDARQPESTFISNSTEAAAPDPAGALQLPKYIPAACKFCGLRGDELQIQLPGPQHSVTCQRYFKPVRGLENWKSLQSPRVGVFGHLSKPSPRTAF
jgi:hypothetical protein